MKRTLFFFIFSILSFSSFAQTNKTNEEGVKRIQHEIDSTFHSINFFPLSEVEHILKKKAILKDSTLKVSNSLMRYALDYVAVYKDSTSKGRIFFSYEQYKDMEVSKDVFKSTLAENQSNAFYESLSDFGNEGFQVKDNLGYPFIIVRKGNRIFRFKLYYLSSVDSQREFKNSARRIVTNH